MDVTESLDKLRATVAGCEIVAYADLSSQMVLSVSTAIRYPQEEIDTLSQSAIALLNGTVAEGAQPLIGEDEDSAGIAVTLSAMSTRVFMRAPGEVTEALICVCAPSSDVTHVIEQGRAALDRLAAHS